MPDEYNSNDFPEVVYKYRNWGNDFTPLLELLSNNTPAMKPTIDPLKILRFNQDRFLIVIPNPYLTNMGKHVKRIVSCFIKSC